MSKPFAMLNNEKGFVLVLAMLILLALVVIGISVMQTTSVEVDIAGNEKFHKIAFYTSDGGIFMSPKVISHAIDAGADPVEPAIVTLFGGDDPAIAGDRSLVGHTDAAYSANEFYNEMMNFIPSDPENDIQFTLSGETVGVNLVHAGSELLAGGGAEFAAGSSGVGSGATGGVGVNYDLTSTGSGPVNSVSTITARYRKIPGTAGGL